MSQFDLSAGTNGDGACILSGKDKPAKPTTKSEIGVLIAPRIEDCVFCSRKALVNVIPQAKNIRDSYRLLSGK